MTVRQRRSYDGKLRDDNVEKEKIPWQFKTR